MTSPSIHACPICDSTNTDIVGPILHPEPALVAGVELMLGSTAYSLWICRECGFQWKDPPIEHEILLACYAAADSDNWQEIPDPHVRQFDLLLNQLKLHAIGRRVLDVGCFNGAMLKYFGDSWDRYGVEPSRSAAELARQRGIQILAATLENIDASIAPFDAILAIDVVEHLVEPLPFFRQVCSRLKSGGVFILLTGNTDALSWRLQKNMYWYCSLPEHLSFYNRSSLDNIGKSVGMDRVECVEVCHKRLPLSRWVRDMIKCGIYLTGRKTHGFGVPQLRCFFTKRRGPSIESANDHLICVFRKQ